ncbi:sigma-70 family RNA polymerase sigma factor [Paenibacillus sp. SYP-B3998]|uniref:Sigma-70 family RNA polymerase sigma factor n=1 Tax=Paenibacillus sp. SYP-B3998 TaxID=2678564 RepID=A0A6G3ZU63_9BACL|nr:sigma-70 family RNA polymerase sigma factor [Paenibacillus sp. SYP-B3998]NEW05655.1 sigma-70 family RNA polymerase sigma factor [Paenibacillus sp. SYP-B3998]
MDDQQLNTWLDRLIAGDQAAFEVIYGMTRKKVYGTVTALVNNKEDVNDIMSEIYYQLWRALPNYDRKRSFLFWLNGIVIKQINNWRRQIWRRFRLIEKKNRLSEEPHVDMPDELFMDNEAHQEMKTMIQKLPFKLRIVLLYRYYYDYSHNEIAELLQIPTATVRSRNHLALKHIRERFENQLDGEAVTKNGYLQKN